MIIHADGSITSPSLPAPDGDILYINNKGSVVFTLPGDNTPYLLSGGATTHIVLTGPGVDHIYAVAPNDNDFVPAFWSGTDGNGTMFWNPTSQGFTNLPDTGDGGGRATGCSARYITFYHVLNANASEPRLYDLQTNTYSVLQTTGTGNWSPNGVTEQGLIFGQVEVAGNTIEAYWPSPMASPTSVIPTFIISDVNDKGEMIGVDAGVFKFWSQSSGFTDVATASDMQPGWHIDSLAKINNSGEILGMANDGNGRAASIVLSPH